jgi:hypothetical protein
MSLSTDRSVPLRPSFAKKVVKAFAILRRQWQFDQAVAEGERNLKLERLVAELSLEKQILKDVAEGNF